MIIDRTTHDQDASLRHILKDLKVIAMVGLSARPERPSNQVARYLLARGYTIIPVNPAESEILGLKSYASLQDIPQAVDIVDCFRKSSDIPPIAQEAVSIGAKVLWLQLEVINHPAAQHAADAGLTVVMDRCLEIEYARLIG